jgi:hypothetical protein
VDNAGLRLLAQPEQERRCVNVFWEAYFPCGQPIPSSASRSYTCSWTDTAQKLYADDDALRHALWANCLLTIGRHHGTLWMLKEAQELYGRALAGVRRQLGTPGGARRDSLIATVKLLSMFEVGITRRVSRACTHIHRFLRNNSMDGCLNKRWTGDGTMPVRRLYSSLGHLQHILKAIRTTSLPMKGWRWYVEFWRLGVHTLILIPHRPCLQSCDGKD